MRYCGALPIVGLVVLAGSAAPAKAAGIDCSRARSATEKAICASPALLTLDRSIAEAYAAQVARQPESARQELLAWLRQRDAACNVAAGAITPCLAAQMTARLAALAPPASAPPIPTAAAAPPPPPMREPAVPSAANPPPPAATLDAASVPAAGPQSTLLHVTAPGRFTIRARSPGGAALQLVDMLAGPSALAGAAGSQDGRLDRLLDTGTYKLRVFSAPAATGSVALTVTPFTDAAAPRALPAAGVAFDADLRDGGQRAFWLVAPPSGSVRIEAAGRSLADLRLWRDGRELTALEPDVNQVEPTLGHPITDARLAGKVEPGLYLAVAYGGAALPWTDNDASQPFHLRAGASAVLAEGWAFGTIGAFGSEVFALPASAERVRLDVPQPAAVSLAAAAARVDIAKTSREASATLTIPSTKPEVVELTGAAGQPYKLQALTIPASRSVTRPGTYWVSAVTAGAGGDEAPATVVLERTELRAPNGVLPPPRIVASAMPVLSPTVGWRGRFNLRGPTSLLFQTATGGGIAVRTSGVPTRNGRSDRLDLPADYYELTLAPAADAQGVVDVTVGPDGVNPPPAATLPANPVLPLGVQVVAPGQTLRLSANTAPGLSVGLLARPSPVALAEGALSVTLAAGATAAIPVTVAPGGVLAVNEGGGGAVAFTMQGNAVVLAAANRPRTIVLAWRRNPAPLRDIPAPPPPGSVAGLQAGKPVYFDLAADQQRGFALTVPDGGLFRVETLGRLHTSGRLATPFLPALGSADGNGAGQNMLIQSMLRAGRYRVDVTVLGSSGHLGVTASPAPLLTGATLVPGGSVRATMPAGSGVGFPVEIAAAGRFHLDVLGLGSAWTGRVEDAEGWPVTAPGPLDALDLDLQPGHYRMLVVPEDVTRQVVARLSPIVPPAAIGGHGPHTLGFDAPRHSVWREPDGREQPRTPDRWTFSLEGPADVTLKLGKGMAGELYREGVDTAVARIAGQYDGHLQAGRYRLDATSLGRNDRLDYTVALSSPALQPGGARRVSLPASVPFAIAEGRVVSLTTWGSTPLKGLLRRADGSTVARIGPRANDWNIAVSRPLPAGGYTLDLAQASPPDSSPTAAAAAASSGASDDSDSTDSGDAAAKPDDDDQAAQTAATRTANAPKADADAPDPSADSDAAASAPDDDAPAPKVELRMALPAALDPVAAPSSLTTLPATGVHVLTLAQPPAGSLLAVQARSSAAIVLTLERQEGDGWRIVALEQGTAPVVAAAADAGPAAWRVQTWTADGGAEAIQLAARAFETPAQGEGRVALARLDDALWAARVRLPQAGVVALADAPDGLLAGGWPGHALSPVAGPVLPEGAEIWLLGPAEAHVAVSAQALPPGHTLALALPAGLVATLPATPPASGHVALWRAESGLGLPGLGAGMGVAAGDTLALAAGAVPLRNAAGDDALRLRLTRLEPVLLPVRTLDAALQTVLAPGTALPLRLPTGDKQVRLDLAPGVAAFAGWHEPDGIAVWTGPGAVSRSLSGAWTDVLLVNAGAAAAPASLSWQPAPAAEPLRAGSIVKRFVGADGSFEVAAQPAPGARLLTAGNAALTVITADGSVMRGREVKLAGPGPVRVVVDTTMGAMAVWEAADGASPWPAVAAQASALPARLPLSGPAMAITLQQDGPVLLHARTTAPVLIGLVQAGRPATPVLYAAGAEFNRMLAAGPAELRLYSPHDGPLSGTLDLSADPVTPVAEGLGGEVSVAPGGAAVFGFTLAKAATVGVGVRAVPDRVSVRLLDATGRTLGEGVAMLQTLAAGRYAIEAQVPPDAPPTTLRPAVIGITPRGNGPPPDVAQSYLELVGMKPAGTTP